ncbi:aldose 1-epimerase [Aliiroseovarius halocynthiae]|uniref:Galactose mutarotase n=1 Tax=Aliiroseovarius halocynthiae TaxID=985055 RepID=A0A545SU68_9RHOB|nr:aldose epimerase family protein [Aliiroseovarius halocynthiae]TQV68487.1 galactose mutarotase [Aliiroseovarius halocynthiae]SMR70884.1 aldose 1-epimerase [Aliiroseovarius halocynthiae]
MSITHISDLPDGSPLLAISLQSDQMQATVVSFGAAVQSLHLQGHAPSLVLGYQDPSAYLNNPANMGVIVGRVANRISGGTATLDGQTYALDRNERGTTTLHGGYDGCSHRNWALLDHGTDYVILEQVLPDGHMGFPGCLTLQVTYRLCDTSFVVEIRATTDAPTFCNPAPHMYFNLDGAPDIRHHRLSIAADRMIPVKDGLPIAGPTSVDQTPFDLRTLGPVPDGLDHHFCLAKAPGPLRHAAQVNADRLQMQVLTTEPGLQAYDGAWLADPFHHPRAGVALEPHRWIDAPNQPWADQVILAIGEVFQAKSQFVFARSIP